jgi:hypothetical protein
MQKNTNISPITQDCTGKIIHLNKFPNCVYIKIHTLQSIKAVADPMSDLSDDSGISELNKCFDLLLTIRFGEEEIKVAGGVISFGLKRGELRFNLENGMMPIESQELTGVLQNQIELQMQEEKTREFEGSTSISAAGGVMTRKKAANKTSTIGDVKIYSIYTKGTEERPIWVFEAKSHEPILKGQMTKVLIGRVSILENECSIDAVFEIRGQRDIFLTDAGGLWSPDIGRNKLAVLEREIFLRFIAPKLRPYLSRVEVKQS